MGAAVVVCRCSLPAPFFQENEAISFFRQIVSALMYVHEQGLCHRDLKPVGYKSCCMCVCPCVCVCVCVHVCVLYVQCVQQKETSKEILCVCVCMCEFCCVSQNMCAFTVCVCVLRACVHACMCVTTSCLTNELLFPLRDTSFSMPTCVCVCC